jgi:predicted enzyme involved in methoxymalonyl-ACP biosynthesis
LICVVILKKETDQVLFIDSWLMSCRVLKRGVEDFVLNTIADCAKANGFLYLKGEYLATPKNAMVKDHYFKLGFTEKDQYWELYLPDYIAKTTYINSKQPQAWKELKY